MCSNKGEFGITIKGSGIRKHNPVNRAKRVLAKKTAFKGPDTPSDSNNEPKEWQSVFLHTQNANPKI